MEGTENIVQQKDSSTAALVMGILGAVLSFIFIGVIFAIIGLVKGIKTLSKGTQNKGKAVAGVVLSGVGILISLIMVMAMGSSSDSKKEVVPVDEVKTEVLQETESDTIKTENQVNTATNVTANSEKITIDEQIIVDKDGLVITAVEYTTDSIWGDGIKLLIENNTDKDYHVGCDALIVNDYMITDLFYSEIAAGKKANEVMYLSSSGLKAAGIDTVGKIEMYFHAYDSDWDYIFKNVYAEVKTSQYDNMDMQPDDAGMELYNDNGIRIVGKTVDEYSFWGTAILLYCENNSGKNVSIHVDDMSINGYMMSPFFYAEVYDGKKAIDDITIFSSDLENNNITEIEEVELKFRIVNSDTYDKIDETSPISFSAK